jgi:cytochrome b561
VHVFRKDFAHGYSWLSIALHWVSGIAVLCLLFTGNSVSSNVGFLEAHTSIAVSFYVILWFRIYWRVVCGHPVVPTKRLWAAKLTHWLMLACIAALLCSGPLMAWSSDIPIIVFGLQIPDLEILPEWDRTLRSIHAYGGGVLVAIVILHVSAVLKHMIVDRDDVFERIMIAAKPRD